jgi:hypothetical protein
MLNGLMLITVDPPSPRADKLARQGPEIKKGFLKMA